MSDRASVRDVAAAAGVSVGSVSRVLNASGYASPALRQRVLQAVEQLGYEPDFTARHLRTGRSRTIGYLLPNIANPALAAHLSEVERLTQAAGYSLLVGSSERPARDRELVAFFENRRLEGLIASPSFEYPDPAESPFSKTALPVVVVERDLGDAFDSVLMDHAGGLRQAMHYLLTLGHRRIALFVSGANLAPGREKLRGYREALAAAGLPFDPGLVFMPESWLESSRDCMARLLERPAPPTALIALGTQMLSGALHVVRGKGLEVPRDFSIVGIGTTETLELMYPPATALRYDYHRSAQVAVQLIMDRIARAAGPPRRVILDWDLVIGGSCGPAPGR
ncbi:MULTISPECIES: LacI family DNA-binding transcriptional regulator [Ramlibacter]|uniref:LacI family DNA-binding transcriptional regulator n=1 Tax=Ramlibacter pinisoli TaxID=2682844 RepID=A0A6N8IPP3_9BURK|nr:MULTISPECIES: LacI family DNA-binding transcriptional regulator [Ramlibacter]MBA2963842.1 LacI family DNA-binding transcriptional regulator [Ramlibacter sp. CGMCC 1.13660]MVQ28808.1 LacI family DNA-binding transcriptional regulator [Ramlibacter pinisoli]